MNLLPTKQKVSVDTWIKLGTYIAGGIAVAYGVKKVLDYFKPERKRQESESKQIQTELEESEKKQKATYPKSVYSGWADAIATAIYGFGTYNDVIVNIFYKLQNNTDYLMLTKAWGNPTRKVYPDGSIFYIPAQNYTLPQALRDDMDISYIKKINARLKSKGIKYRI